MRIGFVDYLKSKNLFQATTMVGSLQAHPRYSEQIIESLLGYKVKSLSNLKPRNKAKIIYMLVTHLIAEREKSKTGSHHYNPNRHIGLLQVLNELKAKKTQPDGGCVISKL